MFGLRIPSKFFITKGKGESNFGYYPGAIDKALKAAGIHNQNLIFYTSILPPNAKRIERPKDLPYGAVLETISAIATGRKGERTTAALIVAWVLNKRNHKKVCGLVAEYHGNKTKRSARKYLLGVIKEMFESRFDAGEYSLKVEDIIIESFVPKKKFGASIVSICFTEFTEKLNKIR